MNAMIETTSEPKRNALPVVTTPSHLLAMAVEQGADLDKLEKLMALQERWEAGEARKAFVAAMAAFKAEPMEILKRKLVSFGQGANKTEYKHAELSDAIDVIVPAMGKHGLSHSWTVKQAGAAITVACVITHQLGHSETVEITAEPDKSGGKNAIQSVASTISYLERYTLLAATGMATKGMDDDGRKSGGSELDADIDQAWLDAVDACADESELNGRVTEMVKAFKGKDQVPAKLIAATARKREALAGAK